MKRTEIKKRPLSDTTLANLEPENGDYRVKDSGSLDCSQYPRHETASF